MRKRKSFLFITLLISLALVATGCGASGGAAKTDAGTAKTEAGGDVVKVGVIYPLTGDLAQEGNAQKEAMEFAQDVINGEFDLDIPLAKTKGLTNLKGAKIQFVFSDSQGKPEVARSEAERLITQQKVVALLGAYASSSTAPASEVAERYGIPFVTPESTRADLTERGLKWFFRNIPTDAAAVGDEIKFLNELKSKGKEIGDIALVYENSLFGTGAAEDQKKNASAQGFKIASNVPYPKEITDVTSEVLKLKSSGAKTILITSYTNDGILMQKAFKEQDFNPNGIIGTEAGQRSKDYLPTLGKTAEYVITTATWTPSLMSSKPIAGKVNELFKKKTNHDMTSYQPHAFTGAMVMADAINRAGATDPNAILKALKETNYPGNSLIMPWNAVKYDDKGQNAEGGVALLQILNGKYEIVWPFELKTADLVWPAPKWSERK